MKDTKVKTEEFQIEIFQGMSPETRLNLALELTQLTIDLIRAGIKNRHPDFAEQEVESEVKKILLTQRIYRKVYGR